MRFLSPPRERQWGALLLLCSGELARADLLLAQQESLDREATYQEALATL